MELRWLSYEEECIDLFQEFITRTRSLVELLSYQVKTDSIEFSVMNTTLYGREYPPTWYQRSKLKS